MSACMCIADKVQDSGRQYKTFKGVRAPDLEPPQYANRDGRTIHLWLGDKTLTSVSCHRNPDMTYSGTMSLKTGGVHCSDLSHAPAIATLHLSFATVIAICSLLCCIDMKHL